MLSLILSSGWFNQQMLSGQKHLVSYSNLPHTMFPCLHSSYNFLANSLSPITSIFLKNLENILSSTVNCFQQ